MYKPSLSDSYVRIWFTAALFLAASICPLWADSEVPPQTTIGQCRSDFDARVNQCITTFLDSKGKRDTAGFQRCYYQSIFFWAICVNDNLGAADRIPQLSGPGAAPVSAAPPRNMPWPPTSGAVPPSGVAPTNPAPPDAPPTTDGGAPPMGGGSGNPPAPTMGGGTPPTGTGGPINVPPVGVGPVGSPPPGATIPPPPGNPLRNPGKVYGVPTPSPGNPLRNPGKVYGVPTPNPTNPLKHPGKAHLTPSPINTGRPTPSPSASPTGSNPNRHHHSGKR